MKKPKIVDKPIVLKEYVIEKTFFTPEGFYGVCTFNDIGNRCGYVGVLDDHPLFGEDYEHSDLDVRVHGGLTFTGHLYRSEGILECEDYWFFGYDCAHGGDAREVAYGFTPPSGFGAGTGTVRTLEYVIEEVLKLSAQLTPQAIMRTKMGGGED